MWRGWGVEAVLPVRVVGVGEPVEGDLGGKGGEGGWVVFEGGQVCVEIVQVGWRVGWWLVVVVVVVEVRRSYACASGGRPSWHSEFEGSRGRSSGVVEWLEVCGQWVVFANYEVEEKIKRGHCGGCVRLVACVKFFLE